MERYTYHIHPHRTITNVIPGKGIRRPMGLKLTKEEVLKCLACGPVYRVFPGIPPIRVTGSNLNDLHVSKDEYLKKDVEKESTVNYTEKSVESQIQEPVAPQPIKNEGLTEEKLSEKPAIEEKIIITDHTQPNAVIDIDVTTVVADEAPAPVEETSIDHTEDELTNKITEMKSKEIIFEGPESEIVLEGPEPVTVEEKIVDESIEVEAEEMEESEDSEEDEDEEEEIKESIVTPSNGPIISQQPHYKKNKKRH